jgi:hypothetical protein
MAADYFGEVKQSLDNVATILKTHRFAIRAIEAEYLRTQLPNAADNLQQNLRIGAGVVLRVGH